MQKACELMQKLDLDIGQVGFKEVFILKTELDVSDAEAKEKVKCAIELCDINVLDIKGGKFE
jgi:hypothetical protein